MRFALGPVTLLNAVTVATNSSAIDSTEEGFMYWAFQSSGTFNATVTCYGTVDKNPTQAGSKWKSLGTISTSGDLLQYVGVLTGVYIAADPVNSGSVTAKVYASK